jgi:8-oxo-dGTP pyrophosphatase MutT (NUDIX family)
MEPGKIRPISICIVRNEDKIFIAEYYDPSKKSKFYRPLGGAIRFGERSCECIIREIQEEMGAEIKDLTYVGMIENIFTFDDKPGHEIVLVYEATFEDPHLYEMESIECQDDDGTFVAVWKPLAELQREKIPLYPEGLLDLLNGKR